MRFVIALIVALFVACMVCAKPPQTLRKSNCDSCTVCGGDCKCANKSKCSDEKCFVTQCKNGTCANGVCKNCASGACKNCPNVAGNSQPQMQFYQKRTRVSRPLFWRVRPLWRLRHK